jgi:hypothetical protein
MLQKSLTAAIVGSIIASAVWDPAAAGAWRYRRYSEAPAVLNPGWGYYSFPWGYTIPTAPYSYPAIANCLHRHPVARPWGVAWREYWTC